MRRMQTTKFDRHTIILSALTSSDEFSKVFFDPNTNDVMQIVGSQISTYQYAFPVMTITTTGTS